MKKLIAYCGLDCEKCEARIATLNNDDQLREKVAKEWGELNGVTITKDMINCMGCRAEGPKTPFCESMCEIKNCACNKNFETCANCKNFKTCKTLSMVTSNSKDALKNLQEK